MKLRNDFVTNSSSSSFIVSKIDSETFSNIVRKFLAEIRDMNPYVDIEFDEQIASEMNMQYGWYLDDEYLPKDVITSIEAVLLLLLDERYPITKRLSEATEDNISTLEDVSDTVREFCLEVIRNKDKIIKDTVEIDFKYKDIGYGGCKDAIYELKNYSEEQLEEIAKNNNLKVKDLDDDKHEDVLYDYSFEKVVVNERRYQYDKYSKLSEISTKCSIEDDDENYHW